jgi:hypothetical protein
MNDLRDSRALAAVGTRFVLLLELHFAGRLEAAPIDVRAYGPGHAVTLTRNLRVRGPLLALPVPALTRDRVEVVVHHHLRPQPFPPDVYLAREVRP